MNRPERFNALSFQVMRKWSGILDELESDLDTRVVIVTGAGRGISRRVSARPTHDRTRNSESSRTLMKNSG